MRNLLIFGMLLIAASAAGWFRVNRQGDRTLIEINQNEIRNDARNAINRGREYLHRGEQLARQEFGQAGQPQSNQQMQSNQQ
ncbi:MAG: hypothetical protein GY904_11595, partial [Planctomycetaceae bacterium]|nr:hypothetical protein [Planctomycetaceae bacterium]